jgi:ferredoxin
LVTVEEDITLTNLEQVVPYGQARDIIIRNPDHIVVLECPCRAGRAEPCIPLDVCLIVGEPFASLVAEHHPRRSQWIDADRALEILAAEDRRGHVHHAFFKDAMLGRFYAICNCCSCCCGAMQAHQRGTPMLASSGFVARVYDERCTGCGACEAFCQFTALELGTRYDPGTRAASGTVIQVDEHRCMGCGVCTSHCPNEALSLVRDANRGEPLEIRELVTCRDAMPIR